MKDLNEKIRESVALIRKGEKLALMMQPDQGYFVGFSGGKDSQVALELCKMAGVKFRAVYNVTTNDPPANVLFIRKHYPEVEFSHPKDNFFRLVEKKGLPTMRFRYCCEVLKEGGGKGSVVITGVRHDESNMRKQYKQVMKRGKTKEQSESKDLDEMERLDFQCVNGSDKFMLYPMLEWTELDVWKFIAKYHLPYNPCYDLSNRIGCMFCPFSSKEQIETYAETFPKYYERLKQSLQAFLDRKDHFVLTTVDEYLDWWKSKQSTREYKDRKSQLQLFDNQ